MDQSAVLDHLDQMASQFNYDVTYMREILATSSAAFEGLMSLGRAAAHRESAPLDAWHAARVMGALAEDCGPCVQLVVDMARAEGASDSQLEAVIAGDGAAMTEDVRLAFRFAESVLRKLPEQDEFREEVRRRWGDKGLIDLSYGMQIGRVFPMLKAALGHARSCQRVTIGGREVRPMEKAA